jgi:hypothetical protein
MRNPQTGKYEVDYTEEDLEVFKDLIRSGTSQEAFVKEVGKMYPENSMWAIIKWYTKIKKQISEE